MDEVIDGNRTAHKDREQTRELREKKKIAPGPAEIIVQLLLLKRIHPEMVIKTAGRCRDISGGVGSGTFVMFMRNILGAAQQKVQVR